MKKNTEIFGGYDRGLDALGALRKGLASASTPAPAVKPTVAARTSGGASTATMSSTILPPTTTSSRTAAASALVTPSSPAPSTTPPLSRRMISEPPPSPGEQALSAIAQMASAATQQTTARAAATKASADAIKAVAAKVKSAGNSAIAAGKRFAKHHARAGNKLVAMGRRMTAVSTKIRGAAEAIGLSVAARAGAQTDNLAAINAMAAMQNAVTAISAMADAGNQIYSQTQVMQQGTSVFGVTSPAYPTHMAPTGVQPTAPVGTQSASQQPVVDAINAGNAIVDQMNQVIETFSDYDPTSENWDASTFAADPAGTAASANDAARMAAQLTSQAQAWLQSAQQIAQQVASGQQPGPFDPGTGGGGGGGGGGSDDGGGGGDGEEWPEGDAAAAARGGGGDGEWPEGDAALADAQAPGPLDDVDTSQLTPEDDAFWEGGAEEDLLPTEGGEDVFPPEDIMGAHFETSLYPDIVFQQFEHQVTDEEPDYERRRASVHRGAAYMQDEDYPPGGASAGQEGGVMRPEQKIEVLGSALDRHKMRRAVRHAMLSNTLPSDIEIFGALSEASRDEQTRRDRASMKGAYKKAEMSDIHVFGSDSLYGCGLDSLAGISPIGQRQVAQPRAGFVADKNGVVALKPLKVKKGDHKSSIRNARDVGKRAVSIGNKLLVTLKKIPKTMVRGVVVAKSAKKVAAAGRKPMSVDRMRKIASATVDAGKKLMRQADKYANLVNTQEAKTAAGKAAAVKALSKGKIKMLASRVAPATSAAARAGVATSATARTSAVSAPSAAIAKRAAVTHMIGADPDFARDYFDAQCDVVGESLPDPNQPGFLMDGTPDPNFDWSQATADQGTGTGTDTDAMVQEFQQELQELGPQPTSLNDPFAVPYQLQPGVDYQIDPVALSGGVADPTVYGAPPLGAVLFDNVPSIAGSSGGQSIFASTRRYDGTTGPGFEFTDGDWRLVGKDGMHHSIDAADYADINAASSSKGYGPIIGRPDNANYKNLRFYTINVGNVNNPGAFGAFWFYDQAPARLRAPLEAARLQQAITDWQTQKTAIQANLTAAIAQAQLERQQAIELQKQQALEDAATQRQMEQEQAANQHQLDMDAAAESAAEQASYEQQQHQQELEAQAYEQASRVADEEQRRQDERDLELARQLDAASAADAQAAQDAEAQAAAADYAAAEQGVPAAPLPPEYLEAAAEQEGGGAAFDTGNVDDYTDAEGYVDLETAGPTTTVMGALSEKQKARLRKYLKKIISLTKINGAEGHYDGADDISLAGYEGAYDDNDISLAGDEGAYGEVDDISLAGVTRRVRGAERIRARRAERR